MMFTNTLKMDTIDENINLSLHSPLSRIHKYFLLTLLLIPLMNIGIIDTWLSGGETQSLIIINIILFFATLVGAYGGCLLIPKLILGSRFSIKNSEVITKVITINMADKKIYSYGEKLSLNLSDIKGVKIEEDRTFFIRYFVILNLKDTKKTIYQDMNFHNADLAKKIIERSIKTS